MAGLGGIFLGGLAQGMQKAQEQDTQDRLVGVRNRMADLDQQKAQKAQEKELLDRATVNFKDMIASGKAIKQNATDSTQASTALNILRDRIMKTGEMLAQIPGGASAVQSALDQFDADVIGTPTPVEAAESKGAASGVELTTKLKGVLGRDPTQDELAKAAGVFNESFGPMEEMNGLVVQKDKNTGKINVLFKPETPESITVGKDGSISFQRGAGANSSGNKGSQALATDAAKKLPELSDSLVGLAQTRALFKPEYLTFLGQTDASLTAVLEKLGSDRSPEAKQRLADLTTFQAKAQGTLNAAIKAFSGTAVTGPEEARLLRDYPDAKTDSPTQFMAKIDAKIQTLKMAAARYSYAARNGLDWKGISLDNMPNIMRDRATAIRQENPSVKPEDLQKQLATEFNLIGF